MTINRRTCVVVAGCTLAGLVVAVPSPAQAAPTTLSVAVGGSSTVAGVGLEGMRFLAPPTFSVHPGDTISFRFQGLDTATLIPVGQSADEWAAENLEGPTAPYSFIIPDSDDSDGAFEFNPKDAFPSDATCGRTETPCAYDGNSVVNSGLSQVNPTFDVTINAKPGVVVWVLSIMHVGMDMRVQVVDDSAASTSQAQIDSYAKTQLAADREAAATLIPKLRVATRHTVASGAKVWDAYAGFDEPGWALDGMFPSTLRIKRGDTVRWHFDQLLGNVHTVTFPRSRAVSLNAVFPDMKCDADPTDTAPDAPPPTFCSGGPQNLELELSPATLFPHGPGKWSGTGFISSGVRGPGAPTSLPYDVKFTHASTKKGYRYGCIVHGAMMTGRVVVS
jgi:plastocyanin